MLRQGMRCSGICNAAPQPPTQAPTHHLVCRAWDWQKPLLLAPAMNTFMWESPFTAQHLAACQQLGATVGAKIRAE